MTVTDFVAGKIFPWIVHEKDYKLIWTFKFVFMTM